MFKKLSKKKGFTLMEMMIVVAIIAIMIAIIIPSFKSALDRANAAADIANLRAYYAEQMAESILDNTTPSATFSNNGKTFSVSGVEYTLKGGTASATANNNDQLIITYKPDKGNAVTIPGTTKTTPGGNSGAGTGSNP